MFAFGTNQFEATLDALNHSQGVIEFNMDGTIITANPNFLAVVGYSLAEIQGRHHSMFVMETEKKSAAYRAFWEALNRGEFQAAEYKRVGKGGKEVWIQASYNPIKGRNGKPFKVVKFATDITEKKIRSMEDAGKIDAILRAQAVIEFKMDGTIVTANENFLKTVGYARLRKFRASITACSSNRRCARAPNIENSGPNSTAANTPPRNTSASARAARKSGYSPAIIRFLMSGRNPSRSSSSLPMLPTRN
jgi:PAS domain S-box-containing protein